MQNLLFNLLENVYFMKEFYANSTRYELSLTATTLCPV